MNPPVLLGALLVGGAVAVATAGLAATSVSHRRLPLDLLDGRRDRRAVRGAAGVFAGVAGRVRVAGTRLVGRRRERKRVARFDAELPEALDLLAGSLEAGAPLAQAMEVVAAEGPEPIAGEFRKVLADQRLGDSFADALEASAERVGSGEYAWCARAVQVQQEFGASLAGVLRTIAEFMRWRQELRGEVRALSAEGRVSAVVLTALPVLLAGFFMVANPAYLGVLVTRPLGRFLLVAALGLLAWGTVWMRRVVKVEV